MILKKNATACVICFALCAACFFSCQKDEASGFSGLGKRPVYIPLADLNDIRNLAPQPIVSSGPIFLRDTLFFMIEQKKGIHVFKIGDSGTSGKLTFFNIPSVNDFTIDGNWLYCDSWRDLVVIDISDIMQIKVAERLDNVFDPVLYPLLYRGPFECVDESKGAVVGWEDSELENARCQTAN